MKELLIRTLTGIFIILLLAGSILLGALTFSCAMLIVFLIGVKELFGIMKKRGLVIHWFRAVPGALLLVLTFAVFQYKLSLLYLLIPPALWLLSVLRGGLTLSGTLAFLWLGIPLASFLALGWMENGSYGFRLPLAIIVLIWINDTFAYLAGSLFGKHILAPLLSPGKTWEGFVGGMLVSLLAGGLIWNFTGLSTLWAWFGVSLIVSIAGLAGDLFESGLKRTVKVKDSGTLLPGHGGVLDRFDSLLFVAPAILILVVLLKLLT